MKLIPEFFSWGFIRFATFLSLCLPRWSACNILYFCETKWFSVKCLIPVLNALDGHHIYSLKRSEITTLRNVFCPKETIKVKTTACSKGLQLRYPS